MSSSSKFFEVLKTLTEATSQGRLHWEETIDEESFRAVTSHAIIRIERAFDATDEHDHYLATLTDRKGKVADTFSHTTIMEYNALKNLYELARRDARKIDQLLDQVIEDVKSGSSNR